MKKLLLILSIALVACATNVDENAAKSKVSELLTLLKNHEFEKTKDYYSAEFNEGEPVETRQKKFEQIESASGAIKDFEFVSAVPSELDGRKILTLTYKVNCANTVLTESFIVANEEGAVKIINHGVSNQ